MIGGVCHVLAVDGVTNIGRIHHRTPAAAGMGPSGRFSFFLGGVGSNYSIPPTQRLGFSCGLEFQDDS